MSEFSEISESTTTNSCSETSIADHVENMTENTSPTANYSSETGTVDNVENGKETSCYTDQFNSETDTANNIEKDRENTNLTNDSNSETNVENPAENELENTTPTTNVTDKDSIENANNLREGEEGIQAVKDYFNKETQGLSDRMETAIENIKDGNVVEGVGQVIEGVGQDLRAASQAAGEWEGLGETFEGNVGQLTGNDYAEGVAGVVGEVQEGIAEICVEVAEAPIEIISSIIEHGGQFVQHVAQGNIGEAVGDTLAVYGYVKAGKTLAVVEGGVEVAGEIGEMVGAVGREAVEGIADVVENWVSR